MEDYTKEAQVENDECEYVDEMPVRSAKQGDDIGAARKKVLGQLKANRDYVANGEVGKLDGQAVYKVKDSKYYVGVKYGNKYVKGVFNNGAGKIAVAKNREACVAKMDKTMAEIAAGQCDAALSAAIAANIAMHKARKA